MRIKSTIAYDGTDFCGWQIQKDLPTIQSSVEDCLQQISRQPVEVTGSGRTDSGVHAIGQVAHFEWNHHLSPDKLLLGMNAILPETIRVLQIEETNPEFHARFDAKSKIYLYRIDRNRVFNPFHFRFSLHYPYAMNLDLLQNCCEWLKGEHDFAAFQATGTDIVSTRRTMLRTEIIPDVRGSLGLPLLCIRFEATGFLRKMVRFLVGTLLEISSGKRDPDDLRKALETGERSYVGVPAPARGLFLEKVIY